MRCVPLLRLSSEVEIDALLFINDISSPQVIWREGSNASSWLFPSL